jgi:hypothetical protein
LPQLPGRGYVHHRRRGGIPPNRLGSSAPCDRAEPALLDHQAGRCIGVTDDPGHVSAFGTLDAEHYLIQFILTQTPQPACLVPEPCNVDRDIRLCARCAQHAHAPGERVEIPACLRITDQRRSAADSYRAGLQVGTLLLFAETTDRNERHLQKRAAQGRYI